ncbi:MAG: hypothetical protein KDB27_14255, partial [Planctomycetales bacterium]|nr:hypothetical protein [Planctomycetales bacterium]
IGLPEWDGGKSQGNASDQYGLLWWTNADGSLRRVPRDAYWAWGLYDSLIIVVPSLDVVVVRAGEAGRQLARGKDDNHYDVLAPLIEPIVVATGANIDNRQLPSAPYPASPTIIEINWADKSSIIRKASGSDNWPTTWADDDSLYTAYGDGRGFKPNVERKLSMGLAQVKGAPPNLAGENIRSDDIEAIGDGARGAKASGMLMVDEVLYALVRNYGNSQLHWSEDHGQTWQAAEWKWTTSFGCPTFLNFRKNYSERPANAGNYVFMYSHDSDSAYEAADRMVMARVPMDRIRERDAYEFFAGIDERTNQAVWTDKIAKREAVFEHDGNCYRSGITYNAGIKRYLWCQTLPQSTDSRGPRFQGGFGAYESENPWGPWRTVFYTTDWDVGPGETSSFPTKWMSDDGLTVHLLFSGDDHFSVRRAELRTSTKTSE